ncbi:MAG: histidine phosphatase family protein [Aquabacterium sp.]|nr:histidine phosphatase family protein [Aquabacterium sp.]
MQATRLVVIRHGETAWNAAGRLQGHQDIPLNALGLRQAAALAGALADEGLAVVVASDLQRAWQTGAALASGLGLPLLPEPGLRERCFGLLEGHTHAEIEARWPDDARRWRHREPGFAPAGGESLVDFQARCLATVDRLAATHAGQTVALVCHGGVLDGLYRAATHVALDRPRSWPLGNASINRLLHTPQGLALVGWNDSAHLDGIAADDVGA